ncbi:g5396 [Coccomyxa elongata]
MMHSFSLVVDSLLGHVWALDIVENAQRVVTCFQASHKPLNLLNEAARALGITKGLVTSKEMRFTSVHNVLPSNVALLTRAVKTMQSRRYSQEQCNELISQLGAYNSAQPPWGNLQVVPHAASTERLFSLMSWYHSALRNRMSVEATGRLAAIKTHHEQAAPSISQPS